MPNMPTNLPTYIYSVHTYDLLLLRPSRTLSTCAKNAEVGTWLDFDSRNVLLFRI